MDRAPSEIWAKIFSFACTDSGFTGRSLSLTSTFFRLACEPYRLQSIAAFGPHKILAVDHILSVVPAHQRRVRYLFISLHSIDHSISDVDEDVEEEPAVVAVRGIMELVADTLEVLGLNLTPWSFGDETVIPMPRLTDLISNNYPLQQNHDLFEALGPPPHDSPNPPVLEIPSPPAFPRLRSFHLTKAMEVSNYTHMFDGISKLMPSLTHIKFSETKDIGFGNAISLALGSGPLTASGALHGTIFTARLSTSIEKVYVRPSLPQTIPGGHITGFIYQAFLKDMIQLAERGLARFVFLRAPASENEQVWDPWADWKAAVAMRGGEDRWNQDERHSLESPRHSTQGETI
ncbi:hypothetical protein HWV62_13054 [Athelia sp. TMB]|nr:hypothetical protein HWV62_13054 [Athelia sp. TMB]